MSRRVAGRAKEMDNCHRQEPVCVWMCHDCGDGGMSVVIEQCPGCQHERCEYCIAEWTQSKRADRYLSREVTKYVQSTPVWDCYAKENVGWSNWELSASILREPRPLGLRLRAQLHRACESTNFGYGPFLTHPADTISNYPQNVVIWSASLLNEAFRPRLCHLLLMRSLQAQVQAPLFLWGHKHLDRRFVSLQLAQGLAAHFLHTVGGMDFLRKRLGKANNTKVTTAAMRTPKKTHRLEHIRPTP